MSVELRTIHAGELALAIDQHTAAAAHAGAIDHDGVETYDRVDVLFASHLGDCPHHHDGADGDDKVDARAVLDQLAEFVSDKSLVGVTAVVGCDHEGIADGTHLWFEDDEFLVTGADDGDHAVAGSLQRCGRGIRHGGAHASADHNDRAEVRDLGRLPEWSDHIKNLIV